MPRSDHPQTKLRKGNVITNMCQEFCPWGAGVHHLGRQPPGRQTPIGQTPSQAVRYPPPPWADTNPLAGRHPVGRQPPGRQNPRADTPSQDGYCSRRYSSYWNAFLFVILASTELVALT